MGLGRNQEGSRVLSLVDSLFNGLSIGAVLLMAALGLAIVFGLMGVINMAHGELMMLGAYTTLLVQNAFKTWLPGALPLYIFPALIAAFLVTALVGFGLERGVIRFLYGRPLETLLATWGVSLIFQQFVRSISWGLTIRLALFSTLFFVAWVLLARRADWSRQKGWMLTVVGILAGGVMIAVGQFLAKTYGLPITKPWFGAQNQDVSAPVWLQSGIPVGGLFLPSARLFIIALTILCVLGVYLFLQKTRWGLRIRAVTQNRRMSACVGIPTQTVDALTFALGSGLAGVAGCAVSLLGSVGPNTGQNYIVDTFMVVVVGGVGKLAGSVVAAMGIGILNYVIGSGLFAIWLSFAPPLVDFFTFFATTSMAKVMVFALIVTFLQYKPAGLFPEKGRTVDA
ncbi:MAG: branched-chain amino acid ABC transporter permease [Synechococcales cyanobacterium]